MSKRDDFVKKAVSWIGTKEKSAGHKTIVADYNKACDKGRKATTATAWCALFIGACAQETDNVLTDGVGVPVDCSCGTGSHSLMAKAKAAGIWVESDSYAPAKGDIIIYDWGDKGTPPEDVTGHDHCGVIVEGGNPFTVVEGNKKNAVGTRSVKVNARYTRGFITPRFADEITPPAPTPTPTPTTQTYKVKTKTGVPLRLRAEPNTNCKVLASMPDGSIVEVDNIAGGWAHVLSYTPPKGSKINKAGYASTTYLVKV